jgi:DNA-binding PadR family transcriptional regulator
MTDTVRDILLAFVRVHVLHHAVVERIYGAGMAEELARHGYQLSPGTLYPLLHRLEEDGLLVSESEVVSGKVRKYYVATAKGRQALKDVRPRLAELVDEALPKDSHDGTRPRKRHKPSR